MSHAPNFLVAFISVFYCNSSYLSDCAAVSNDVIRLVKKLGVVVTSWSQIKQRKTEKTPSNTRILVVAEKFVLCFTKILQFSRVDWVAPVGRVLLLCPPYAVILQDCWSTRFSRQKATRGIYRERNVTSWVDGGHTTLGQSSIIA